MASKCSRRLILYSSILVSNYLSKAVSLAPSGHEKLLVGNQSPFYLCNPINFLIQLVRGLTFAYAVGGSFACIEPFLVILSKLVGVIRALQVVASPTLLVTPGPLQLLLCKTTGLLKERGHTGLGPSQCRFLSACIVRLPPVAVLSSSRHYQSFGLKCCASKFLRWCIKHSDKTIYFVMRPGHPRLYRIQDAHSRL